MPLTLQSKPVRQDVAAMVGRGLIVNSPAADAVTRVEFEGSVP